MQNRLPYFLIAIGVALFFVYSSIFVVNEREQAIVLRFGQIQDVKAEPGLYFKLPFAFMDADRVQYVEDRALRFDLPNIRVQVRGGAFYEVDAFAVYRITDAASLPRNGRRPVRMPLNRVCAPASMQLSAASTVCATSTPLCPKSAVR